MANLSDKLIRKAEAGGPIQLSSVQALVKLYNRPEAPVRARDLIDNRSSPRRITDARVILQDFVVGVWKPECQSTVTALVSPEIVFHCENGQFTGRDEFAKRVNEVRRSVGEASVTIQALNGTAQKRPAVGV